MEHAAGRISMMESKNALLLYRVGAIIALRCSSPAATDAKRVQN
jgi:hypothetical protein